MVSDGYPIQKRKSPLTCTRVQVRGLFVVSLVHPARFELATSGFVNRGINSIKPDSDTGSNEAIGELPLCLPQEPQNGLFKTPGLPSEQADFAAAILAIERLPLSDEHKAEAIRRLLGQQQSRL